MFPPDRAFYSTTTSLEFVTSDPRATGTPSILQHTQKVNAEGGDGGGAGAVEETAAMLCTQRAGDLMFVPTLWGHGTFNTMRSIGVAHEFSVEDICME
jgi:hypothetical protein